MDFSCKQKDFCQRRTKFFGVKCPSVESADDIAYWQTSVGIYQHMTNQFGIIHTNICKNVFSNQLKLHKYEFCAISMPSYFLSVNS